MKIQINPKLYEKCHLCSQNRWSNKKKGFFGRGMINSNIDPYKVERIGLLGEAALAKYINKEVDYEYKEGGTPFDFNFNGLNIDIKTAARNYGSGLIRAVSDKGRKIELKSDIYVFGYLEWENKKEKKAEVVLTGWMERCKIEELEIVPARVGQHFNYDIPYEKLNPIETIKTFGKTIGGRSGIPFGAVTS